MQTFTGDVEYSATVSPGDAKLVQFSLRIAGKSVASDLIERYKDKVGFDPSNVALFDSAGYLPASLRDEILGLGPPYLVFRGLTFKDLNCKSERRYIQVLQRLDTEVTEVNDECL